LWAQPRSLPSVNAHGRSFAAAAPYAADTYTVGLHIDMPQPRDPRLKLSFEQANAICREFLPVGDEVFSYTAQLRKAGFEAFLPRHEFIESFAETSEELEIHRRCVVETAKEKLGQPTPIAIYDKNLKQLYFSPFLQQLRDQRDEANGCPFRELSSRFKGGESVWRREIDPCQRRLVQDRMNQRAAHEVRFTTMIEAERRALEDEAKRCATGFGKSPHTFDSKGRYAFFAAVMERNAASLGFHYDKSQSRSNYPVFSKAITDDWHLCWAIEEPQFFFFSPFEGRFEPSLELRSRELAKNKPESGELLIIRYRAAVPGYFSGYLEFFDLDQLERDIIAHLYLYSLMAPIVEHGIKKVMGDAA
jgi:hypothetical protein